MNGYIVKGIGGFYYVKTAEGIVECKPRGIFRKQKITPVAGDEVTLETENGAAVIAQIAPRKNVFVRPPVANLVVLFWWPAPHSLPPAHWCWINSRPLQWIKVFSPSSSVPKATWPKQSSCARLMKNPPCLSSGSIMRPEPGWTRSSSGSQAVCARSAETPAWANPRCSMRCCQTWSWETGAISQKLGRGRHTTREVTIFEAFGGRIADTPGFASLEANRAGFIPKENLEHAFPEFGPYLGECQFTGCSHRAEKGCAVRAALAEGKLSQTRYDSYCAMYDEVKDVKDWQRPKV